MKNSRKIFGVLCVGAAMTFSGVQAKEVKKAKHIEVLLLNALPGSGKSEVRRYLSTLTPKECSSHFGIGDTVQLDDFPYVHMMRRISDELTARGHDGAYFLSPALPFRDAKQWGTLMHLMNEDYKDLITQKKIRPKSVAQWLFKRLDAAYIKSGGTAILNKLPSKLRQEIAQAVEVDAAKLLKGKVAEIHNAKNLKEKTIVMEFSRGGADQAPMPLPQPYGYKYSIAQLSPEILSKASMLYLDVSPEESRRKNEARVDPSDPGSILNHAVPRAVMYCEYGCDDINWLLKDSDKPNMIRIQAHGKTYYIPVGRFDNKVDKTTFAQADPAIWKKSDVQNLRMALNKAFLPLTVFIV